VRSSRPSHKNNEINELPKKNAVLVPPIQSVLFHVEKQIEIDGVEMGVLMIRRSKNIGLMLIWSPASSQAPALFSGPRFSQLT